jgi:hypothetical protein
MYNLGTKYLIDNKGDSLHLLQANGTAATTAANTAFIRFSGLAQIDKATLAQNAAALTRYVAGAAPVLALTVSAGTVGAPSSVNFTVEALSSRYEADYSRQSIQYGKLFSFSVTIAAGATATDVATAVQGKINERIAKYGDLPFTVTRSGAVLTLTGVAGKGHLTFKMAYDGVKVAEIEKGTPKPGLVTVAQVVTPGIEAVNSGKWLEENISMQTGEAGRLGAARPGETPVQGANYTAIYFTSNFVSEMVAAPGQVGKTTDLGSTNFAVYLNETAVPTAATSPWALFTEIIIGVTGSTLTTSAGVAADGINAAAVAADFWGIV